MMVVVVVLMVEDRMQAYAMHNAAKIIDARQGRTMWSNTTLQKEERERELNSSRATFARSSRLF